MKAKILLAYIAVFYYNCGISQQLASIAPDSLVYDLFGSAHALMCPFLSPKLQNKLEIEGGKSFIKTEDLHLIFKVPADKPISEERVMELVEKIGYEPAKFSLLIRNE